jgi:hypothetical protein
METRSVKRAYAQSKCPQCQGVGMVCSHCGYGGKVPDWVDDERHTETLLCPSCVPDAMLSNPKPGEGEASYN